MSLTVILRSLLGGVRERSGVRQEIDFLNNAPFQNPSSDSRELEDGHSETGLISFLISKKSSYIFGLHGGS